VESSSRPLSQEHATDCLLEVAARLRVRARIVVMTGETRRCIARAAREQQVDLVMASRAHRDSHAVYGGDVLDVLPRLYCPLVSVPLDHRTTVPGAFKGAPRLVRTPMVAVASPVTRSRINRHEVD
jgi:hypothetical protein